MSAFQEKEKARLSTDDEDDKKTLTGPTNEASRTENFRLKDLVASGAGAASTRDQGKYREHWSVQRKVDRAAC